MLLVALLVVLALPGVAAAADVRAETFCEPGYKGSGTCYTQVTFRAAPGERNDVIVTEEPAGMRFHDAGARVVPLSPECEAVDEQTVQCGFGLALVQTADGDDHVRGGRVSAHLGEGDDRAEVTGGALGEAGDDVLVAIGYAAFWGGPGDDVLRGAELTDHLEGGPGTDVLDAGGGNDGIGLSDAPGPPAPDRADGGPGVDLLHYREATAPLEVDLSTGRTGGAAGADVVAGFENLQGGDVENTLTGDAGPNAIFGGNRDDRIAGGAGDDQISTGHGDDDIDGGVGLDRIEAGPGLDEVRAGPGDDRVEKGSGGGVIDGGPGDDRIEVYDQQLDRAPLRIACGDGLDVTNAPAPGRLAEDCEWLRLGGTFDRLGVRLPLRLRGRHVTTTIRGEPRERGIVLVRDARTGRVIGRARWAGFGVARPLRIVLAPAAARLVQRRGRLAVTIQEAERRGGPASARVATAILAG